MQLNESPCRRGRLPRKYPGICPLRNLSIPAGSGPTVVSLAGPSHRGGGLGAGVPLLRSGQFCGGCASLWVGTAEYPGKTGLRSGESEENRQWLPCGDQGGSDRMRQAYHRLRWACGHQAGRLHVGLQAAALPGAYLHQAASHAGAAEIRLGWVSVSQGHPGKLPGGNSAQRCYHR